MIYSHGQQAALAALGMYNYSVIVNHTSKNLKKEAVSAEWMKKMLSSRSAMKQLPEDTLLAAVKGKTKAGIGGPQRTPSGDILRMLRADKQRITAQLSDPSKALSAFDSVKHKAQQYPETLREWGGELFDRMPWPGIPRVPAAQPVPKMFAKSEAAQLGRSLKPGRRPAGATSTKALSSRA